MGSSSLTLTMVSMLFFTLIFMTVPISCDLVADICNETIDTVNCQNLFYNNRSSTDTPGLDKFVIDYAFKEVKSIRIAFQSSLSKTIDPKQMAFYTLCLKNYEDALGALAAAREKLTSRDFPGVRTAADVFSRDAVSCRKAFDTAPDHSYYVTLDVNTVELYGSILVATSRRL